MIPLRLHKYIAVVRLLKMQALYSSFRFCVQYKINGSKLNTI